MSENTQTDRRERLRHRAALVGAACAAPAAAATVLAFAGRFHWSLDLFSHFRAQYFVALLVLSLPLLALRRWKLGAAALAFACLNLPALLPLYFGGSEPATPGGKVLRVVLLNVNRTQGDPARVAQFLREQDPDLAVLLEVDLRWLDAVKEMDVGRRWISAEPRTDNFGLAVISKAGVVDVHTLDIGGCGVPSLLVTLWERPALDVLATHPPPPVGRRLSQRRNAQFRALPRHTRGPRPMLVLGDLNTTPWNYHYRRMMRRSGLVDSSRGHGLQPTWPAANPLLRIPIDHCLHSPDIAVLERRVGPDLGSDHLPVILELALPAPHR